MPSTNFSKETTKLSADAETAIAATEREHARDFTTVPAQYRQTLRFLMRMTYYTGRADGAQYIADSMKPQG